MTEKYSFWKELKEAIRGSDQDYSRGPLRKAIVMLSIPMVLEMLMESIFVVVDILYVSRLGSEAVAAVGITESMMTIVVALGLGLATGATAIISRRFGEQKYRLASISAVQAIFASFFFSILVSIPAILYPKELLQLMGATPEVVEIGYEYFAIMLGANLVLILLFVNNAIFRSAGDAVVAMRVLWFANILNIILAPIFIFWLGLGVKGAAIATVIGRGSGVVYQFWLLFDCKKRIKIFYRDLVLMPSILIKTIRLSLGATAQNLIITISWVILMSIVAGFGSDVVAGYTIAIRILIFVMLPSWGLSNAAATLVGQSLGADNPARAVKAVWATFSINAVLMSIVGIILISIPEAFIGFFIQDPEVILHGKIALRIFCFGLVSYSIGMVMVQAINGAGDTYTPILINIFCFILMEVPLAYFLSLTSLMEKGVYWSVFISETILTLLATLVFVRGKWKNRKV